MLRAVFRDSSIASQYATRQQAISYLENGPQIRTRYAGGHDGAEMLTIAAEREIARMFFARIATLRAIHRNEIRVFNPDRKDHHWGRRKLARDR